MTESRPAAARVLVVDDDDAVRETVCLSLSHSGYTVERAPNGETALDHVREDPPDVVLLDVMMPGMNGWQVLRSLKADPKTRDVPVVMLTALAEERDVIQGQLEGAVSHVTKPFTVPELLDTVAQALLPPDENEPERRRETIRALVRRLAEIDAGRTAESTVHLSRLESARPRPPGPGGEGRRSDVIDGLTPRQTAVARELARGQSPRQVAEQLGVTPSNVYATRQRVARKFGVRPAEVAEEARRLGLQ
jgi:CheY-like chemotaxis protein/DNA-binding CsgD family transcriptional regulator